MYVTGRVCKNPAFSEYSILAGVRDIFLKIYGFGISLG